MIITIIIPLFNSQNVLKDTLDSVLAQTYKDWECLIIDDGSTDNSVQIAKEFQKTDKRIKFHSRLHYTKPKGVSSCRNIGIENAKGKFVIFLDSDDILSKDCLKNRIEFFRDSSNIDFAVFCMGSFNEVIGDNTFLWNKFEGNLVKRFLSHDLPWALPSILWNKSSLEMLNGFD